MVDTVSASFNACYLSGKHYLGLLAGRGGTIRTHLAPSVSISRFVTYPMARDINLSWERNEGRRHVWNESVLLCRRQFGLYFMIEASHVQSLVRIFYSISTITHLVHLKSLEIKERGAYFRTIISLKGSSLPFLHFRPPPSFKVLLRSASCCLDPILTWRCAEI